MRGMALIFVLATLSDSASPGRTVFDFLPGDAPWRSIDDTVMGGRSSSEMRVENGTAVFTGNVSPEDGGGFASVRSQPSDHDLTGFRGVVIRVRGDGKVYGLRIKTDSGFDGVNYQASFAAGEQWEGIEIAFDEFKPVFRGRPVPGHPALDPASIKSFGLIISRKQYGPFRLEVDWIRAL